MEFSSCSVQAYAKTKHVLVSYRRVCLANGFSNQIAVKRDHESTRSLLEDAIRDAVASVLGPVESDSEEDRYARFYSYS